MGSSGKAAWEGLWRGETVDVAHPAAIQPAQGALGLTGSVLGHHTHTAPCPGTDCTKHTGKNKVGTRRDI